jgi:Glycosyl hydrolases family 18
MRPDPRPDDASPLVDSHSFDLLRQFIEELTDASDEAAIHSSPTKPDWSSLSAATRGIGSIEQAIGRTVVVASQMALDSPAPPERRKAPRLRSVKNSPWDAVNWMVLLVAAGWSQIWRASGTASPRRRVTVSFAASLLLASFVSSFALASNLGSASTLASGNVAPHFVKGNDELLNSPATIGLASDETPAPLPAATAPPQPAPPSLANAAPLRPHEVFGFAPYWTLSQSAGFNVQGISTLAYFSIDVNADGSLDESGPGWQGYESQALATLITRAHAAGDRVVLTANCFDQSTLDQLTSSPTAATTLATALVAAVGAKNMDGVNLDFEGEGSSDQAGLTKLVGTVSNALHQANPHYQVTMDTYASSAGDPNGFYNIATLAPEVDAFFVMEYQLNLQSTTSAVSPLTSTMFSDHQAVAQYTAVVPASKVILGMPYFGIDWPTTDGTLTAQATGPATDVSYGQVMASGHPIYWDAQTDTAWTSYEVGTQWHETFFEDAASLYDAAQLANSNGLGGMGIWALGMDGNDPTLLSALLGFAPAVKAGPAGPVSTSTSSTTSTSTTTTSTSPSTSSTSPSTTSTSSGTTSTTEPGTEPGTAPGTTTTSSTEPVSSSTTTTTQPASSTDTYAGTWNGGTVPLTLVTSASGPSYGTGNPTGQLTGFTTNDPALSCLASESTLNVWAVTNAPDEFVVVAQKPGDCATAEFTFTDNGS